METTLPSPPPMVVDPHWPVPGDEECMALWDRYDMVDNIRRHSLMVAHVATVVAEMARERGMDVHVPTVRASAMLHDIAKTYCILHGGSHHLLGGAWVVEHVGNPIIASGVTHHVFWKFKVDLNKYFYPLAVRYADTRVRHDRVVPQAERFEDLIERYVITPDIRARFNITRAQGELIEKHLSEALKVDLNACSFDSGRLV